MADPKLVAEVAAAVRGVPAEWQAPTLLNSWANKGGSFARAGFRKLPDGIVVLRGTIDTGAAGNVAFTLPEGCRPSSGNLEFPVASDGGYGQVTVGSSGNVRPDTVFSTWLALDGIVFLGDQ